MPNWSSTAAVNDPKKYRFGYNGKEDDDEWGKQDYGARIYDGRVGRFLSVDPLMKEYASFTPYQFASNTPIQAVDLEGLEHYFAMDGSFIGVKNSDNTEIQNTIVVINDADAKKYSNKLEEIHNAVTSAKIVGRNIPVANQSYSTPAAMSKDQLLDLAHITFGEERGGQATAFAHVIWNGEQKAANSVKYYKTHDFEFKTPHTEENSGTLMALRDVGGTIFNLNIKIIGQPRTWDITSGVLHKGNPAVEYDANGNQVKDKKGELVINKNYSDFFKYKYSDLNTLFTNVPETKNIISEIFKARLDLTTDPCPNCDSWKGNGVKNTFSNDRNTKADGKSDVPKPKAKKSEN